jgi:hypothetical protein
MKRRNPGLAILCLSISILPRVLMAADYFVKASGDDAAAGTSPRTAWKSVERINRTSFSPGDRILFQAGQDFQGNLRLGPNCAGRPAAPVVITSHGKGRAKILAGGETGITIESAGCIVISNLTVVGAGPTNNSGYGILFDNRLEEFQRLQNIRIEKVEVSGFGIFGILVSGKSAGFDHVRVSDCDLHDNLRGGMEIAGRLPWDSPRFAHSDVRVTRCLAHNNTGDPNYHQNHSGSGMVLYQVDGGLFEDCRAWANGQLCHHGNGGVGIWSCASRRVVIQHCESFENRTSGGDGGGFDLDGGSVDCVLQYNYSHDNDGPGLMVYTYAYASHTDEGCIVRFNVSEDDSRRSRAYAGLWVRNDGNGISGLKIYNNTVRIGPWSNQAAFIDGNGVAGDFQNNLFIGYNGARPLVVEHPAASVRFQNNLYWSGGAPLKIRWGEHDYDSLSQWRREASQESLDGKNLGLLADPELSGCSGKRPGNAESWQRRLAAYKPRRNSPLLFQGIAVGEKPLSDDASLDILGNNLNVKGWPLGAVGYRSR